MGSIIGNCAIDRVPEFQNLGALHNLVTHDIYVVVVVYTIVVVYGR